MIISSRKKLISLINKFGIETYPVCSKSGRKIVNTIIYNKYKDKFYRIKWGEIIYKDNISHLWYDENVDEVFLNKSIWEKGWHSKQELIEIDKKHRNKRKGKNLEEFSFCNIEKNMIDCNTFPLSSEGKSRYTFVRLLNALCENQSILFFSTNYSSKEIEAILKQTAIDLDKNKPIDMSYEDVLSKSLCQSKLKIYDDLIESNYIISEMQTQASKTTGLDLVIIDNLKLNIDKNSLNNYSIIVDIHSKLEKEAVHLGCKMIINTQFN